MRPLWASRRICAGRALDRQHEALLAEDCCDLLALNFPHRFVVCEHRKNRHERALTQLRNVIRLKIDHAPANACIDTGFNALHEVVEYWDRGSLKVFRGTVTMTPDDKTKPAVRPVMTHFFYMDEKDPTKVRRWFGAVGPIQF